MSREYIEGADGEGFFVCENCRSPNYDSSFGRRGETKTHTCRCSGEKYIKIVRATELEKQQMILVEIRAKFSDIQDALKKQEELVAKLRA